MARFNPFQPGTRAASQHEPSPISHLPLRGYVKEQPAIRSHHSNFVIRHSNLSAPPELRKPESVRLATPKSDVGGLAASRMRDGATITDNVSSVNN